MKWKILYSCQLFIHIEYLDLCFLLAKTEFPNCGFSLINCVSISYTKHYPQMLSIL
jgi:hypothetical protein